MSRPWLLFFLMDQGRVFDYKKSIYMNIDINIMKVILFFLIASVIAQGSGNNPQRALHCTDGCVCIYNSNTGHAICDSCLPGYIGPNQSDIFPCTSKWLITSQKIRMIAVQLLMNAKVSQRLHLQSVQSDAQAVWMKIPAKIVREVITKTRMIYAMVLLLQ